MRRIIQELKEWWDIWWYVRQQQKLVMLVLIDQRIARAKSGGVERENK